jgi:DNA repair protein RadC
MQPELPFYANIVSEVDLIYRSKVNPSERPKVVTSKDCYNVLMELWDQNKIELQEEFKVLLLNRANRVLGIYNASAGGISGTVADPRLIYTAAL